MFKLSCLLMAASLGAAVMATGGAPYEQMAQHLVINQATAHDVIKTDAHQAVMREAQDHPPLPAGMKVVLPQPGGELRVIARSLA